jgi:hypothetical protein
LEKLAKLTDHVLRDGNGDEEKTIHRISTSICESTRKMRWRFWARGPIMAV